MLVINKYYSIFVTMVTGNLAGIILVLCNVWGLAYNIFALLMILLALPSVRRTIFPLST